MLLGLPRFMRVNMLNRLPAELEVAPSVDGEPLLQREINLEQPRTSQRVAGDVSPRAGWRAPRRGRQCSAMIGCRVRIWIKRRARRSAAGRCCFRRVDQSRCDDVTGQRPPASRLHQTESCQPPNRCSRRLASAKTSALSAKRQLIHEIHRQRVPNVLIRVAHSQERHAHSAGVCDSPPPSDPSSNACTTYGCREESALIADAARAAAR